MTAAVLAAAMGTAGMLVSGTGSPLRNAQRAAAALPASCTPTTGAPQAAGGPVFLTCVVSFADQAAPPSGPGGVTVTEQRGGTSVSARVWDNHVNVVLPAGYDPGVRYPVVYLLHGAGDTFAAWEHNTDLDEYLSAHAAQFPYVFVMPDGGANSEAGWYSDWADGSWQYETFDTVLLPDYVARNFSTLAGDTAIAGLSMGGFGALSLAARHPGSYKVAASFSGAVDMLYGAPVSGVAFTELHSMYGTPTSAVWGDQVGARGNWEAHNPTSLAPRLTGTTVLLASGTGTPGGAQGDALDPAGQFDPGGYLLENFIFQMNLSLVRALTLAGVPYSTNFYAGGYHGWPYWQADLHWALPLIAAVLGSPARP